MTGGFYFVPPSAVQGDQLYLPEDEARHATRVMRLGIGDEIRVVDGAGNLYRAEITAIARGAVTATIRETYSNVGEPGYELDIGIGVLKSHARMETFLEKAVELGVTGIFPFQSERVQKATLNRERCRRVMVAGLKQSMRSRLPVLADVKPLFDLMTILPDDGVRCVAHEEAAPDASIMGLAGEIRSARRVSVLIGPEGGFTEKEIERAERLGWKVVSLGHTRLRTETAAIAAAAVIQMIKATTYGPDRT